MKLDAALGRRLAALVLLLFIGFLMWRLFAKAGKEVDLVYDLSRVGRTDLRELRVELRREGEVIREADFRYPPAEASAPTQQRHHLKLGEGTYTADFRLRFTGAPEARAQSGFALPQDGPVLLFVVPRPVVPPVAPTR